MSPSKPAAANSFERVYPGWRGDWHPVPHRVRAVYLSGSGEMIASDSEVRKLVPGTVLLAEDTTWKGPREPRNRHGGHARRDTDAAQLTPGCAALWEDPRIETETWLLTAACHRRRLVRPLRPIAATEVNPDVKTEGVITKIN
jgi:hypothetical protein